MITHLSFTHQRAHRDVQPAAQAPRGGRRRQTEQRRATSRAAAAASVEPLMGRVARAWTATPLRSKSARVDIAAKIQDSNAHFRSQGTKGEKGENKSHFFFFFLRETGYRCWRGLRHCEVVVSPSGSNFACGAASRTRH